MSLDLYSVLNVSKSSTDQEIKAAYKKLALQKHPDKNNGETTQEFLDIQHAYEILSDSTKREIYDNYGSSKSFDSVIDWRTFINDVASHMFHMFKANIFPKDITIDISVSLKDIYNRKFKKINVKVKRWVEDEFITQTEIIYIDLSECLSYLTTFTFEGKGDSSIFRKLSSSNIIVNVYQNQVSDVYISDDFGISITFLLSLYEFNNMEELYSKDLDIYVPNFKCSSYTLKNMGLYKDGVRGDLYVFIKII